MCHTSPSSTPYLPPGVFGVNLTKNFKHYNKMDSNSQTSHAEVFRELLDVTKQLRHSLNCKYDQDKWFRSSTCGVSGEQMYTTDWNHRNSNGKLVLIKTGPKRWYWLQNKWRGWGQWYADPSDPSVTHIGTMDTHFEKRNKPIKVYDKEWFIESTTGPS